MEKSYILPVILCGGSGTRLWPLSRASYPKQFSRLTGKRTLFQETLLRLSGSGYAAPILLTAERFRFIVAEQAAELGRKPQAIILEPESRNTAPAILAAALHVMKTDPDALLLVMPSDHYIPDAQAFRQAIAQGRDHAERGFIITLGIKPDRAETGYGYLELAETSAAKAIPLKSFVEKPSAEDARKMLKSGRHLWNAGIFFFSCRTMVEACEKHAPYLMEPVKEALAGAKEDLDFLRLDADAWARARDISIDYAVMEKAGNLVAVPYAGKWSDLGDWEAVWRVAPKDDMSPFRML